RKCTCMTAALPRTAFRTRARAALLGWLRLEEPDTQFVAVDAGQFTAAPHPAGRHKNQKELLEVQPADRLIDDQPGAALRDVRDLTRPTPGSIDADHPGINASLERYAF